MLTKPLPKPTEPKSKLVVNIEQLLKSVLPAIFGLLLFVGIWTLISHQSPNLPGPMKTWDAAVTLFSDPFYDNGPNDKGIGWNILASLQRVSLGFGMAALVGIPLGFIIGRFLNSPIKCVLPLLAYCVLYRLWLGYQSDYWFLKPPTLLQSG